jgi:hypothetical protein
VIGAGEFEQRSQTAGERGRHSTTQGDTYRDLAPASVAKAMTVARDGRYYVISCIPFSFWFPD